MRKIKFKFYEKKGNSYEPRLSGFPKSYLVDGEGSVFLNITINKIGYSVDYLTYSSDVIAVQYTGLKDKNGTKIFEGDIVKIIQKTKTLLDKVIYDNHLCGFRFEGLASDYCDFCDWLREGAEFEVVGNIYENPELLGDKND